MNILIANVGNIRTNEIKVLAEALNKNHKVTIISMGTESSNRGLAFSFSETPVRVTPLTYKEIVASASWVMQKDVKEVKSLSKAKAAAFDGIAAYEFVGNPADAMSITLKDIVAHKQPDLVICGINNGVHFGQDIYCSSNIGMAMESTFFGYPTIAIAVERKIGGNTEDDLSNAVKFIEKNVEAFAKMKLPENTFLSVNIPTVDKYENFAGVRVARMSRMSQLSSFVEKTDPLGNKYYWANNVERLNADSGEQYARTWYDNGHITVVPLNYDATDYTAVETWDQKIRMEIEEGEA